MLKRLLSKFFRPETDETHKGEINSLRERLAQSEQRAAELEQALNEKKLESENTVVSDEYCDYEPLYRSLAVSLIKFRDQLLYFKDGFRKDGDDRTVKLLGSLYKETGRFMKENGIEPLEEGGTFDAERHVISSTVDTDNAELDNTIESTFMAGYRIYGEMYRPQEIVLYILKD